MNYIELQTRCAIGWQSKQACSPLLCLFVAWDKGEPLHVPDTWKPFTFIVSSWLSVALCKAKGMPTELLLDFRQLAARSFWSPAPSGSVKDLQTNHGKAADFAVLWAPTCHDNKQQSHNPASDAHLVSLSTHGRFDHRTDIELMITAFQKPKLSPAWKCWSHSHQPGQRAAAHKSSALLLIFLMFMSRLLHPHPPHGFGRKQQPRDYYACFPYLPMLSR